MKKVLFVLGVLVAMIILLVGYELFFGEPAEAYGMAVVLFFSIPVLGIGFSISAFVWILWREIVYARQRWKR
jgi:hypothetical protein